VSPDPFVHLHVASGYSLQYGASHPHVLVERARELEMDTLALTDRDGAYGAVRFAKACVQAGIRPVLGVDLAVAPTGLASRPAAATRTPARGGAFRDQRLPRTTFLAGSKQGWAALCRLVSATHLAGERGKPVTTLDLVAEHVAGQEVLVLLGPTSELGHAATVRRDDLARAALRPWLEVVDRTRLLAEIVSHRLPGTGPGSSPHAARMVRISASESSRASTTRLTPKLRARSTPSADVIDICVLP